MNMHVTYSGCFRLTARESAIGKMLGQFAQALRIDQARVCVERAGESAYPFRVRAHLVTPGPDVIAEGHDYTFDAALRKLRDALARALRHRREKRERRKAARKSAAPRLGKPARRA